MSIYLSRLEVEGNTVSIEVADGNIDRYAYTTVDLKTGSTREEKLEGVFCDMLMGSVIPNESCYTLNILLRDGWEKAAEISQGVPVKDKEKALYRYISRAYLIPKLLSTASIPDKEYEKTFIRKFSNNGGERNCGKGVKNKNAATFNTLKDLGIQVTEEIREHINNASSPIAKDNFVKSLITHHFDAIERRDRIEAQKAVCR